MTTKRKSKLAAETAETISKRLKELQDTYDAAIKEEEDIINSTEIQIKTIVEGNNMFCGVILNKEDLLNIISLMIDTREQIKIPFKLYYND